MNPLTLIRQWLASKGVRAAPSKISQAVTVPRDATDEEILRLYTRGHSSKINDALAFKESEQAAQLADKLGVPMEELVARMNAMANQSSTMNAPTFSGIMTPRYLDLLKRSSETPHFISTSPDLNVADRYAGHGLMIFNRPGKAINPGKSHVFSDEPELILPTGRPLKLIDETEIRDKSFNLPVMLYEKRGGLVALKGARNG